MISLFKQGEKIKAKTQTRANRGTVLLSRQHRGDIDRLNRVFYFIG